MATTARQNNKPARKGGAEPARRAAAWTGPRNSQTFSPPPSTSPRLTSPPANTSASFPALAPTNGARPENPQDRVLQSLSGLTGTTITLLTKTSQRYEGVIASTNREGDTTGVTLKDVKEISAPGAPLKESFFIASTNIESWTSGPADAKLTNGDTFRTDGDINKKLLSRDGRELEAWGDSPMPSMTGSSHDDETFGPGSSGNSWDQFAANEQLFGVKASFDENLYTTVLDRTTADYKERERKAQKIANEIMGTATSNPHLAEERNQTVDDSGLNEEDKYGAVIRGTNAYVPPGARKPGAPVANGKNDIPKVSVNAPDGASQVQSSSNSNAASPTPPNKPPADPLPAFRDFVTNERQRLTQKRQALVKNDMDKRIAELVEFGQSFKLNKPIPDDLVPILAKDEEKQKAIREKANKDAASVQARSIGPSTNVPTGINSRGPPSTTKLGESGRKPSIPSSAKVPVNTSAQAGASTPKGTAIVKTEHVVKKKPIVNMVIQPIPAFKGKRQSLQPPTNGASDISQAKQPLTPNTANAANNAAIAANRLNVNASSFRPTTKAPSPNASTSNPSIASSSASPKPKDSPNMSTPNPFFGSRPIRKTPVNVKDDFNLFKHNKVADAATVTHTWPYSGKRYLNMFPHPQHHPQQQSPHMGPPGPPPMPPPSYEEDTAAQAAARGYVYYPQYAYPGQPMMPGMGPPPPGFMPAPYMQMPYPPGMPPNAMYGPPGMAMPPPGAYMQAPPGSYPPPPNGINGPRPSMPPTPIPAHAHPYYQQSPQMQHAVPYPMMMPPPNSGPPHGYETGVPQGQMGGHS